MQDKRDLQRTAWPGCAIDIRRCIYVPTLIATQDGLNTIAEETGEIDRDALKPGDIDRLDEGFGGDEGYCEKLCSKTLRLGVHVCEADGDRTSDVAWVGDSPGSIVWVGEGEMDCDDTNSTVLELVWLVDNDRAKVDVLDGVSIRLRVMLADDDGLALCEEEADDDWVGVRA